PRILPALPERISAAAHKELAELGVDVRLNTRVTSANALGLETADGSALAADLMVWAAGIKVPDFMKDIAGLETNRINQLVVTHPLQTCRHPYIVALGDCVEFMQADGSREPPRAQAAHQMATCCYQNLLALRSNKSLKTYIYRDHGSLVSLAQYSTVGSL